MAPAPIATRIPDRGGRSAVPCIRQVVHHEHHGATGAVKPLCLFDDESIRHRWGQEPPAPTYSTPGLSRSLDWYQAHRAAHASRTASSETTGADSAAVA